MVHPLHHVFVLTAQGAPEGNALVDLGLAEGSSNTHHGQGTANRRFFFRNAMLELLWVTDEEEARQPPASSLGLHERWSKRTSGASSFGICIGPNPTGRSDRAFDGWAYRPAYLPDGVAIHVAHTRVDEPLVFQHPFGRPDVAAPGAGEPLEHPLGVRALTRVEVRSPVAVTSRACHDLTTAAPVHFELGGDGPIMTLTFDGGTAGRSVDLRPGMPLVLGW